MLSALFLGVLTVWSVEDFQEEQLKQHLNHNLKSILNDYYQDGINELRHDIRERINDDYPNRLWYFLKTKDGTVEFDPLFVDFPEEEWSFINNGTRKILFHSKKLKDGYRIGIGIGLEEFFSFGYAIRRTFFMTLLIMLTLGTAGAYLVTRTFLVKIENLKRAIKEVGRDELSRRISKTGSGDEFDQLIDIINGMLARIEALVNEIQTVSANVAHDLRTPLGKVKQRLEALALQPNLNDDVKDKIHSASDLLEDSLNTFSAILRISEINSGHRKKGFVEIHLKSLLENIFSAYEAVVEEQNKKLKVHCKDDIFILGDPLLITQLLVNLIENSLLHSKSSQFISIDVKKLKSKKVELSVCDDGVGVKAEILDKITSPFYKGDISRSSKNNGLGLSLVAAIVKLHDGELKFESLKGLTVSINLERL